MRLLVTRPEPQASRTATRLRQRFGAEVVVAPMLEIIPLEADAIDLAGMTAVALTSARAIEAVRDRAEWTKLWRLPVYCVGTRTADAARSAGAVRAIAAQGTAEDLARLIAGEALQGAVLYLAGQERSADLAAMLAETGVPCRMVEVYGAKPIEVFPTSVAAELQAGHIDWVLVYSRRTAQALTKAFARLQPMPRLRFACLSENVGELLRPFGAVHIAASPDEHHLFALLEGA
ncbi:uroporphyrinogen-III synthase [Stappia sp. F7233]|uniref:Uroporphyrinogen-III synthase n=1 Tax=Stappia albiluteola TaxID=2758565 RepID=A0A839AHG5_9HYPH|nr:uroporphyrinogen-III synthase [Stappia albiluteola]MBA5778478.1 uroporphyrinogen-III synthase [Stappia albiluteola]